MNISTSAVKTKIQFGAWSGLFAGIVFGAMMGMMGMLPMVAKLAGSENAVVGFVVHIIFSIIIGIIFALIFDSLIKDTRSGIGYGIIYGSLWWVIGPLVLMPLFLEMGIMLSPEGVAGALPSLWGHLVYGVLFGFVYNFVVVEQKIHAK